jgi:acyl transferase domain-containing protein/acyl carrier protein
MSNDYDIAIIGMSCRLPGAQNVDEFWANLCRGIESIRRFSDEELLSSGVPHSYLANPSYVKAAPILEEPGAFDADFFGFSRMEARTMDPQHRILLELAHEALENAGYDPDRCQRPTGVFTGAAMNTYFMSVGLNSRLSVDYIPTLIGNDKDFLSTRISYKLNLKGPSITVQTACSTSMVAMHLARQSLLSGETDMALAGAISIRVPHRAGYFCDGGGIVSSDGHVRAFDARANGTVFGSGGGILVLKRLADAISDGDTIHAIFKGSAVNNDGAEKVGYTAPSVNSQADVVVEAMANAGVESDSVSYVETHGSGTPVGDPIEVRALTKAFHTFTDRSGYCAIGSVKTNVGHLDVAAGITGIIKTVLALKHRQIPPSLHFNEANPEIDFAKTPFFVNTELREWISVGPRRAGVMSTGMGGTNAHVVLEEAPEVCAARHASSPHLLVLSAKTEKALEQSTNRLREFLNGNDAVNMSDVEFTLRTGRKVFPFRRYLVCGDREEAVNSLTRVDSKQTGFLKPDDSQPSLIYLLPGIGDHYVGMAHELYETQTLFKQEVDRCAEIIRSLVGKDIRDIVYPKGKSWKRDSSKKGIDLKKMLGRKKEESEDEDTKALNLTQFAQPALFTIEYAMSRLWQSLGVYPDAIIGHSMGEYLAACLAQVLSLDDALKLITIRAQLVSELPEGAMLAVILPEEELLPLMSTALSVSLINGPDLCVVAGPVAAVAEFERELNARNILCRRVRNGHAFHSRMLEPIVETFEAEVSKVRLKEPTIPYISNVTGRWITSGEATNPGYWAKHATQTARFSDALLNLWQLNNPILLEVGPGRTLITLALQHPARSAAAKTVTISSLRHDYESKSDMELLLHGLGKLWTSSIDINWENVCRGERRYRIPLPTYPFERQNHWLEAESSNGKNPAEQTRVSEKSTLDDWFYVPTWERTSFPPAFPPDNNVDETYWLIFGDRYGGGACVKAKLDALGRSAGFVCFGKAFNRWPDGSFELNPSDADDYVKLFRELEVQAVRRINVVHLAGLTRNEKGTTLSDSTEAFGFYSLLHLAQAIGEANVSVPIKIGVVTNRIHEVTGEEPLDPGMATMMGPCGVIPKEFQNVKCFNVDLPDNNAVDNLPDEVFVRIFSEYADPIKNQVVAYRGRYRWERGYLQVNLPNTVPRSTPNSPPDIRRLRHGGVYLITGGTGGIGLSIARYLAEVCQPKLVLTKKRPFPDKSRWRELLQSADTSVSVVRTIKAILEIEQMGAEVEVVVAESSDKQQMQEALKATIDRFKTLNGVIHAAGIVRAGLIQTKTKEVADSVLAPKVCGTMILFDLVKDLGIDFLILFSSITSIITPYAESDYSGANSFLDAFAHFANRKKSFHTLTINWPGWKEVGQLAELETLPGVEGWKEAALKKAITTKDGLAVFEKALNSDLTQVIVSPENLSHLLDESQVPFDPTIYLSQLQNGTKVVSRQDRGQRNGGNQPTNEVEAIIIEIWRSVLGFDQIGIHDNFSQLGGHSLLAIRIVGEIRRILKIDLPVRALFDQPTVAELADYVKRRIIAEIDALSEEEALRLLQVSETFESQADLVTDRPSLMKVAEGNQ